MGLEMKYFVLNPRSKSATDMFAAASRSAMMAYANIISYEDADLANQLIKWVEKENLASLDLLKQATEK